MMRDELRKHIKKAIKNLEKKGEFPHIFLPNFQVVVSQRKNQGDYSTNLALVLGQKIKRKPKTLAKIIQAELAQDESLKKIVEKVEVASPGFINFYIAPFYLQQKLANVFNDKNFGKIDVGRGTKTNIDFVSINPTGELHVGHARSAFYGDVLSNILAFTNHKVTREYYLNNACQNSQIKELGKTALKLGTSYKTPYLDRKIKEHAKLLKSVKNPKTAGFILASQIQKDIKNFLEKDAGIHFNVWAEEEELYRKGEVKKALEELKSKHLIYEADGAIWMRTKKYGDTQDQVVIRSGGEGTYFLSDIAYHKNKVKRGFKKLIDIWGADHQGHVKRMKSAMKVFKIRNLDILISQMVTLKGGAKLSKRRGNIVTIKDLLDAVGKDAARFFYLTKSLDSQMDFDLDLAREQSQKNPAYYIQYTYARCCSILRKSQIPNPKSQTNFKFQTLLKEEAELDLIKKLLIFPEVIEDTARDYQVHRLTAYVLELARTFSQFYEQHKVLVDDEKLKRARLALLLLTSNIIKQCLDILGITAPKHM